MKQGWETKTLGDVCDVLNGLWTGKKEPFVNICVIRNTNFTKDCKLNLDNVAYIDAEVKQFTTRKLKVGDIIVEKSGGSEKQPVGRVVLFDVESGDYSFSNFTSALRVKSRIDLNPNYLHKCLYAHYLRGETFKLQSKTTGLHNLDMKGYLKLPIPVPSLSEQEKIVAELDCLSSIIEKKKQQLKEYDALAQSIFHEMFGNPVENEMGLTLKQLGDVTISVNYGTSSPANEGGKFTYLRMNNLTYNGYLDLNDIKTIDVSEKDFEKCVVRKGDILFNRTNSKELVGKTALFNLDEEMVIAGYIIRVRVNKNEVLPIYVVRYMNTPYMKSYFCNLCKGAVNQANINSKELKAIPIPIPPLALQQEFVSKIEAIEKQKELIKKSIENVKTLFNSRMDYYFN